MLARQPLQYLSPNMLSLGALALALVALGFTSRWQVHGSPLAAAVGFEDDASTMSNGKIITRQSPQSSEPIPPTSDPFYTAPKGYQKASPGDILRIREAPGNLTTLLGPNCSAGYNILYRTRNSQYKPDWAVTTVLLPANDPTTAGSNTTTTALLSYQIPYDSAFLDASPSYALYGADGASPRQDISTGLSYGWLVNVPDYEGPLASFTAGVQSGHATLDSVRAVMNAVRGEFRTSVQYHHQYDQCDEHGHHNASQQHRPVHFALWGYSGGALASEWAAELQVQYAPELLDAFKGGALGGLTPNVTSVLLSVNGALEAGLIPPSILGLASQYPDERAFLLSRLKTEGPYNATGFLAALNYTLDEAIVAYAFQDIGEYFVGGLQDLLGPVPTRLTQRDGMMGYHGVPQVPLYVYKAIADEVSVVNDTDALVERFCNSKRVPQPFWEKKMKKRPGADDSQFFFANRARVCNTVGANILYDRNTVGGHSAESTNGKPAALAFLDSVLSGANAVGLPEMGCAVNTVSVNITDSPLRRRGIPGGLRLEYDVS